MAIAALISSLALHRVLDSHLETKERKREKTRNQKWMDGWMGFFPFLTYFFLTTVAKNQERFGTIGATLLDVCRMSMWLLSQRVLFIQSGGGICLLSPCGGGHRESIGTGRQGPRERERKKDDE